MNVNMSEKKFYKIEPKAASCFCSLGFNLVQFQVTHCFLLVLTYFPSLKYQLIFLQHL